MDGGLAMLTSRWNIL